MNSLTPVSKKSGAVQENGYIESFKGRLRDELLDRVLFDTLWEVKVVVERWRNT